MWTALIIIALSKHSYDFQLSYKTEAECHQGAKQAIHEFSKQWEYGDGYSPLDGYYICAKEK